MSDQELALRLPALRRLYEITVRLTRGRTLAATLQAIVDGVVEAVGFAVCALNDRQPDGSWRTLAAAGPQEVVDEVLGRTWPPDAFDREFALADEWGALRYVPHDRFDPQDLSPGIWVPDIAPSDDPDAWHPLDALYAPLESSSHELIGILSVDLPEGGRRPQPLQRELLEMFASQAGIALENARLTEALEHEHARLQASEHLFRLAFDASAGPLAMMLVEPDSPQTLGRFLRANAAYAALTGYSTEELLDRTVAGITHPEDVPGDLELVTRALAGDAISCRADKRYLRADGSEVWVAVTTSLVRSGPAGPLYAFSQVEDLTERRAAEQDMVRAAVTDPLTGLANRSALQSRLVAQLAGGRRGDRSGGVLFCDLDRFKVVNDSLGHRAGDVVLMTVAKRLLTAVRETDLVARLGGDEFVVVTEDIGRRELASLARRIRTSVALPITAVELAAPVHMTASIGIALLEGTTDAEEVLGKADAAMYRVKQSGRDGLEFHGAG